MINNFRFSLPVAMRWNDLDPLGHVNNIYYFEYFQIARGQYMPVASPQWNWNKNMFVIAHLECDYLKELTIHTPSPIVKVRTSKLSGKSFEMEYIIVSSDKDGVETFIAKGKSVNVMVDIATKRTVEIPGWLRKDIIAYEPDLN